MPRTFPILVAVLVFSLALFVMYLHDRASSRSYAKDSANSLTRFVNDFARNVSLSQLHESVAYEILNSGSLEKIDIWIEDLKSSLPLVEAVQVLRFQNDFGAIRINSANKKLLINLGVYDDSGKIPLDSVVVLLTLDSQRVLDLLGIKDLRIASEGEDFAYGLKYAFTQPIMNGSSVFISILVGLASYLIILAIDFRRRLFAEEKMRNLNEALISISTHFLSRKDKQQLFQLILEKALQVIPKSQAGSLLIRKGDKHLYVAAIGYDIEELSKIEFSSTHHSKWLEKPIKKRGDLLRIGKSNGEVFEVLKKAGKMDEIMCTLSVGFKIEDEITLTLNLDNFESENAFDKDSVFIATLFVNYLREVFARLRHEEKIYEQQQMMEYLYNHDPLTGLLNRRGFAEYGEKLLSLAKREAKKVGVLFIDLSNFKAVNDRFSHQTGDFVLKTVGVRLMKALRHSDLVSRFGGDEFVVLLYEYDEFNTDSLFEKIFQTIEEPIKVDEEVFKVRANMGVSVYPKDALELDQLVRIADVAMYYAKKNNLRYVLASSIRT